MNNVLKFPCRTPPVTASEARVADAAQAIGDLCDMQQAPASDRIVALSTGRELQDELTEVIRILETSLNKVAPLLEKVGSPADRFALARKIAIACFDVKLAKLSVDRLARGD